MNNNKLKDFMVENTSKLNIVMENYLSSFSIYPILKESMLYSVNAGGKRLRPLLILSICKSLRGQLKDTDYCIAGCLELIHTYSLIHDDLPSMDNDDFRRGKLSNHMVYGTAVSILTGDGLLTTAFEWLASLDKVDNDIKIKLIYYMAKAAGIKGMVNGQIGDITRMNKKISLNELNKIHQSKSGALIQYACFAGAILGGADALQKDLLINFGKQFGLAFQIRDDIMDIIGSKNQLGKNIHMDDNKNSYPNLVGLDNSRNILFDIVDKLNEILTELKNNDFDIDLLSGFLDFLKN